MAAIWPASLPQASLLGDSETFPDTVLKTDMDAGVPKRRNRFTAGLRLFEIPLYMTNVQANVYYTFFTQTLKNGALPFEWKIPRTAETVEFLHRRPPKLEAFTMDSAGAYYRATLELEVLSSGSAPSAGTIVPFSEAVSAAALSKDITHNLGTVVHKIFATANWLTQIRWTAKTTTITTLEFSNQAPASGAIVEGTVEL